MKKTLAIMLCSAMYVGYVSILPAMDDNKTDKSLSIDPESNDLHTPTDEISAATIEVYKKAYEISARAGVHSVNELEDLNKSFFLIGTQSNDANYDLKSCMKIR
jgi:hypothetical protein